MPYDPYKDGNIEPPADIDLPTYAKAWIDMEPHYEELRELAHGKSAIVEFGIRGGVSTWAMLDSMHPDGTLYGVDIVPDFEYLRVMGIPYPGYATPIPPRVRRDPRFQFLLGDSLTVRLPERADMVVIDASHEFAPTVGELMRAAAMKPAVIACHDYLYSETPGVRLAIDGYVMKGYLRDEPYRLDHVSPSKWGLAVLMPR